MALMPAIRIIGRWGQFRKGEIIRPPASLRTVLLREKVAELVEDEKPKKQTPFIRRKKSE